MSGSGSGLPRVRDAGRRYGPEQKNLLPLPDDDIRNNYDHREMSSNTVRCSSAV
jgi:hypothetical protein